MIEIKRVRPVFTGIVTTASKWELSDFAPKELVYKQLGQLKDYQRILSVGESVREVKPGDLVMLDFGRYSVKKYPTTSIKDQMDIQKTIGYDIPGLKVGGEEVLVLDERDVTMVIEEWEEQEYEWNEEEERAMSASRAGIYSAPSTTLDLGDSTIRWDGPCS